MSLSVLIRLLLSGLATLIVWTVFDVLMRRVVLRDIYEAEMLSDAGVQDVQECGSNVEWD
jgi:hypothetical protein